jgi:hypothetical protein
MSGKGCRCGRIVAVVGVLRGQTVVWAKVRCALACGGARQGKDSLLNPLIDDVHVKGLPVQGVLGGGGSRDAGV